MQEFKIGELVKYTPPNGGTEMWARVEGSPSPRRWRIAILPDGLRLTVPGGDITHKSEDVTAAYREASRDQWDRGTLSGNSMTDQQGNYYSLTNPDTADYD